VIRYPFIALMFVICVACAYLSWTNFLQKKEADRLGVPNWGKSGWSYIEVDHPRCSDELRRAYRKTNRLFWLNGAVLISMLSLLTWL